MKVGTLETQSSLAVWYQAFREMERGCGIVAANIAPGLRKEPEYVYSVGSARPTAKMSTDSYNQKQRIHTCIDEGIKLRSRIQGLQSFVQGSRRVVDHFVCS